MKKFFLYFFIEIVLLIAVAFSLPDYGWISGFACVIVIFVIIRFTFFSGVYVLDPKFKSDFFFAAFFTKMLMSAIRIYVGVKFYHGAMDAFAYYDNGRYIAEQFRTSGFNFLSDTPIVSTKAIEYIVGVLYYFLPLSFSSFCFIFAALAFIGSIFFYKAFCIWYDDRSSDFYKKVVFFLPSILYWPSCLGKDALIFFASGIATYGIVKFFKNLTFFGLVQFIIGLSIISIIRPHIAGFMVIAVAIASVFSYSRFKNLNKFLQLIIRVPVIFFLSFTIINQAKAFLTSGRIGMSEFTPEAILDWIRATRLKLQGKSKFIPVFAATLLGPLYAIVTLVARPFIWEAGNLQTILAALECLFCIFIFYKRRKVIYDRFFNFKEDAFSTFAFCYVFIAALSFTVFTNMGILARQRTTVLPFLWLLFA